MKRNAGGIVALVAAGALLAAACSSSGSTARPEQRATSAPPSAAREHRGRRPRDRPQPAGPNIVFIPKAINNPYFDAAATGAQEAATALGGKFNQIGSQSSSAADQIPFIQDATTQGYEAIVVSATDADAIAPRSRPPRRPASRSSATTPARPKAPMTSS